MRFLLDSIIFRRLQPRMGRSRQATENSIYEYSKTFRNQLECRMPCTNELLAFNILFFYHVNEINLTNCEKLISK